MTEEEEMMRSRWLIDFFKDLEKRPSDLEIKFQLPSDEEQKVFVKIQKVPNNIRNRHQDCFTPREISIGPIHSDKPHLAKRDLKLRFAATFMENSEISKVDVLNYVNANFKEIKNCYEESVVDSFHDDDLLLLLFLDGCFVLQFIHAAADYDLKNFEISSELQSSIERDMFLLENQLPWRLLEMIMKFCSRSWLRLLVFMEDNAITSITWDYQMDLIFGRHSSIHLLDVLHKASKQDFVHMKTLSPDLKDQSAGILRRRRSFRNVQDLKVAGIKIKPSDSNKVSFSRWWIFSATLRLPQLIVDKSTESKLLNLLAYEIHHKNCDFKVSSYLSLMDLLVDTEQDVRDLRDTHVIRNHLGSDDDLSRGL